MTVTLITAPGTKRTHASTETNGFGQRVALCQGIADHKTMTVEALQRMGYTPAPTLTCPSCRKLVELDTFAEVASSLAVEL